MVLFFIELLMLKSKTNLKTSLMFFSYLSSVVQGGDAALCVWGLPVVAVQVLVEMKKAGVHLWSVLHRVAQFTRTQRDIFQEGARNLYHMRMIADN